MGLLLPIMSIGEDEKIVVRYSGYATYSSGISEIGPTHQRIFESGVFIFKLADGRVREIWNGRKRSQNYATARGFPFNARARSDHCLIMVPLHDDNPTRIAPFVTYGLNRHF